MTGSTVADNGSTGERITSSQPVRPVRQRGPTECGITCLSMVLESHGAVVTLDELRAECPAGANGVSLRALAMAARGCGFRARALAVTKPDAWREIPLPAIALFHEAHFVVIERHDADAVQAVDPTVGKYLMETAAWDENFSGVVLTLERHRPGTSTGT